MGEQVTVYVRSCESGDRVLDSVMSRRSIYMQEGYFVEGQVSFSLVQTCVETIFCGRHFCCDFQYDSFTSVCKSSLDVHMNTRPFFNSSRRRQCMCYFCTFLGLLDHIYESRRIFFGTGVSNLNSYYNTYVLRICFIDVTCL